MRQVKELTDNWYIKSYENPGTLSQEQAKTIFEENETDRDGWLSAVMPNTVQEVLFEKGLIDKSVLETGSADSCTWVSEKDWAFRTEFAAESDNGKSYLKFSRLDTTADIFLNGEKIGQHKSMFMPSEIDVSGKLQPMNDLLVYFYSPHKIIELLESGLPLEYNGKIGAQALLRKAHGDFSPHGGAVPYFTPIGVYDSIELIQLDKAEIRYADIDIRLNEDLTRADLYINIEAAGAVSEAPELTLLDCAGRSVQYRQNKESGWSCKGDGSVYTIDISVDDPELWWPVGYGDQPLYELKVSLKEEGSVCDAVCRKIGMRKVETVGDLKFRINGTVVRMWGSCITPMWGASHRWQPERGLKLLDYAVKANMKALRLWGPSQPYDDEFYNEADRLGILIWQEFHTSGTHMPDLPEYNSLVVQESVFMVKRLKHHPCIFMWCGGNEQIYMADLFDKTAKDRIGHDMIYYTLKDLVQSLDPYRYYHISSPSGGEYANQAGFSDNHGSRASLSYLPGEAHAHFFSEDIRTSVPELPSLKRFILKDELWPSDFIDTKPYGVTKPLPPAWMDRTINHMEEKAGPYELFYDATDPESLIYKMNEAAAFDLRNTIHSLRHGKPFYNSMADRQCNGYLAWKLNTAWPQIYCAFIDYYLEPGRTYYALRRAYTPIHISCDLQDQAYIWGVNDTREHFGGKLLVECLDLVTEEITHSVSCPVGIPAGESLILKNLDSFGQFWRTSVIHVLLTDAEGKIISEDYQFIVPERRLTFPKARLQLKSLGSNELEITSDRFARCVTLSGDDNGDTTGWHFEDNYFNLMPGQPRRIRLLGRHSQGKIKAKAYYSPHEAEISLK